MMKIKYHKHYDKYFFVLYKVEKGIKRLVKAAGNLDEAQDYCVVNKIDIPATAWLYNLYGCMELETGQHYL